MRTLYKSGSLSLCWGKNLLVARDRIELSTP